MLQVYEGGLKYIFISYAHKDADVVLPVVAELQRQGFRIWYDRGIEVGTEWPEYIAGHLVKSACVIAFMSNAASNSRNCRNEINMALSRGIDLLVVHLEETQMTLGLELQLNASQAIYKYRHESNETFIAELMRSSLLFECKGPSKEQTLSKEEEEQLPEPEERPIPPVELPPVSPSIVYSEGLAMHKTEDLRSYIITGIGECKDTHIFIPTVYNNLPVSAIDKKAFAGNKTITAITIPASVEKIGGMAFADCKMLTDIYCDAPTKPSGYSVVWMSDCYADVHWGVSGAAPAPAPKKSVAPEARAFVKLQFELSEDKSSYIVEGIGEVDESTVRIPETYNGLPVTAIKKGAFDGCKTISEIFIPASVTRMGGMVFSNCPKLRTILCASASRPKDWSMMWKGDSVAEVKWGHNE